LDREQLGGFHHREGGLQDSLQHHLRVGTTYHEPSPCSKQHQQFAVAFRLDRVQQEHRLLHGSLQEVHEVILMAFELGLCRQFVLR
jgi:hypothetical protein